MSELTHRGGPVEQVIHMLTDAELEAIRKEAREDGAGLALAAVVNTLTKASRRCPSDVAVQLLDLNIALAHEGRNIIRMIGERKAP